MLPFNTFVAHSFSDAERNVVRPFLDFLDHVAGMGIGFTWDHAEPAEPKELRDKVLAKMEGKNLLVAICTAHERATRPEHLKRILLRPGYLMASAQDLETATSDWITQEIGCAVGRGMRIVILLERGVRVPGGLQGDLEYIEFDRDKPERTYTKLLEMLRSLSALPPSGPAPAMGGMSAPTPHETTESAPSPRKEEPSEHWTRVDFDNALFDAVLYDDEARQSALTLAYSRLVAKGDQSEDARWGALALYYKAWIKKEDTLAEILAIRNKHPNHPDILSIAARAYETYKEPNTAAALFEESASLTDEAALKGRRLCRAAVGYASAGHAHKAQECLSLASSLELEGSEHRQTVFAACADVARITKSDSAFEAFSEALLEQRPDDHGRRSALAWHYSEAGEHDLALYHYGILVNRSPDEGYWNNYGVAAANLKLPATSVRAYRDSQRKGGTLAMSNIAHKFLNEGFLEEAEQTAIEAMKQQTYDKQVGSVLPRMRSMDEEEATKRDQLLQALQRRRQMHIAFANAAICRTPTRIPTMWMAPDTSLTISLDHGVLKGTGRHEKKATGLATQLAVIAGQKDAGITPVHTVIIAPVVGRSGLYRLWVKEGKPPDPDTDKPTHIGLLILSEDLTAIDVYQAGTRDSEAFYRLTALEDHQPGTGA